MMNTKDKEYIGSLVGSGPPKLSDYDDDGYPDIFDCDPFDPAKDGAIGQAWDRLTGAASRVRRAAREVYAPSATRARRSAAQVTSRVRASAASVYKKVDTHRRTGVERAAAIRSRPKPKPKLDIVKTYKETERRVSALIPTFGGISQAGARFGERPGVQRAYQYVGRQVLRLPDPIKAVGTETFKFSRGAYKEFQQKPVTIAAHTAMFAAAGPVIGAGGRAAVAGRALLAARAASVARVPVVGKTAVSTGRAAAPVISKAAKYAMPAMGALWAGSIAQRVHATPAEMRSEAAGRIFMGEAVPMAAGLAVLPAARAIRPTVATAKSFPESGVEQVAKQLYIGKHRVPIGYEKTVSQKISSSAGKTQLSMEAEYRATVGQLKYSHTRFARGQIEGDYFLPSPKTPLQIGKVPVTEAAAERLMLPSPAAKPTRLYAELTQRYAKAKEVELTGGRTMRWFEAGKRKLEYGVPKTPKYELPDVGVPPGAWGVSGHVQLPRYGRAHPSYPPSMSAAEAKALQSLTGVPRPKMISERMHFQDVAPSSRYYESTELLSAMRKPAPSPTAAPIIPVPKPAPKPPGPKPIMEPMMEPAPAPAPRGRPVEFAEPTSYETPWAEPKMARAPLAAPKQKPLPFAEPVSTRFEFPWAEPSVRAAPKTKVSTKPAKAPESAPKRARTPTPYTAPYRFREPLIDPLPSPKPSQERRPSPTPSVYRFPSPTETPAPAQVPKPSPERRPSPSPSVYPYPAPAPAPVPAPSPSPSPATVTPYRRPPATPAPKPIPKRPPAAVPPAPPAVTKPPLWMIGDNGEAGDRVPSGKRKRAWKQKHELITLQDFLGYKP